MKFKFKVKVILGVVFLSLGLQTPCVQAKGDASVNADADKLASVLFLLSLLGVIEREPRSVEPFPVARIGDLARRLNERPAYAAEVCDEIDRLINRSYSNVRAENFSSLIPALLRCSRLDDERARTSAFSTLAGVMQRYGNVLFEWRGEVLARALEVIGQPHNAAGYWCGFVVFAALLDPEKGFVDIVGDEHVQDLITASCRYLSDQGIARIKNRDIMAFLILGGLVFELERLGKRDLWYAHENTIRAAAGACKEAWPVLAGECGYLIGLCINAG